MWVPVCKGIFPCLLPFKNGKCFPVCSWTNVHILHKFATLANERGTLALPEGQDKGLLTCSSLWLFPTLGPQ